MPGKASRSEPGNRWLSAPARGHPGDAGGSVGRERVHGECESDGACHRQQQVLGDVQRADVLDRHVRDPASAAMQLRALRRLHDLVEARVGVGVGDAGEGLLKAVQRADVVRAIHLLPLRGLALRAADVAGLAGAVVGRGERHQVVHHRSRVGPEPHGPTRERAALTRADDRDPPPGAPSHLSDGVHHVLGGRLYVGCAPVGELHGAPRDSERVERRLVARAPVLLARAARTVHEQDRCASCAVESAAASQRAREPVPGHRQLRPRLVDRRVRRLSDPGGERADRDGRGEHSEHPVEASEGAPG